VCASLQRLDYESEFDEGAPRMTAPSRLGGAVSERLRRLDDTLGIDHNGGSEWIWGVPAFIFVATVVGFIVIGQIIGMGAAMAAPIGTVIAVVMAGLAIAYMTPVADDAASGPPPEHHDDTPLGSPGGPWVVVEHLPSRPRLDANPTPAPADRELAAIAGPQHGEGVRVGGRRRLHHQGSGYMRGYERRVPGPALAAHRRTGGPQIPCYAREYGGAQSTLLELS
jgi:hypothetical protein